MRRDEEGWDGIIPFFVVFGWESSVSNREYSQQIWDEVILQKIVDELIPHSHASLPYPQNPISPLSPLTLPPTRSSSRNGHVTTAGLSSPLLPKLIHAKSQVVLPARVEVYRSPEPKPVKARWSSLIRIVARNLNPRHRREMKSRSTMPPGASICDANLICTTSSQGKPSPTRFAPSLPRASICNADSIHAASSQGMPSPTRSTSSPP
jgi:hypothetical protein